MSGVVLKLEFDLDDIWSLYLCLKTREETGNNNDSMKSFLFKQLPRLEALHQRFADIDEISTYSAEVVRLES